MKKWLLLLGAILSEVTGSLSLRGALDEPALYLLVVAGFVGAFALLAAVLRQGMPLGIAYGVWAALGVALTSVLSSVLFGEPFTLLMGAGIALIMGGVLLVEVGSHQPATTRPGARRRGGS